MTSSTTIEQEIYLINRCSINLMAQHNIRFERTTLKDSSINSKISSGGTLRERNFPPASSKQDFFAFKKIY